MKNFLLFLFLFLFSSFDFFRANITAFDYLITHTCDHCPFQCCNESTTCASEETSCGCDSSYCFNNFCVNNRCGSFEECNKDFLYVVIVFGSLLCCCCICRCWVCFFFGKKRKIFRMENPTVVVEDEQVIQIQMPENNLLINENETDINHNIHRRMMQM